MTAFLLTNKAKIDLTSIANYTENRWGINQRNLYIKQLDEAFHLLAANSSLDVKCANIRKGYRKHPVGAHIIYYNCNAESEIIIVRILHKNMDAGSKFV